MARKPPAPLSSGTAVLVGRPGISMPWDWFLATVLWADGRDVLIEHQPPGSGVYHRQVLDPDEIIAAGSYEELREFKRLSSAKVKDIQKQVRAAEDRLSRLRNRVWSKLDELAEAGKAER